MQPLNSLGLKVLTQKDKQHDYGSDNIALYILAPSLTLSVPPQTNAVEFVMICAYTIGVRTIIPV